MKLFEILGDEAYQIPSGVRVPRWATPDLVRHIVNMSNNPKLIGWGNGSQAYVHASTDPQEQDFVIRTASAMDGGTMWLQYIHDHPILHNNPFIPKIISAHNTNSKNPSYKIERLYKLELPSIVENDELMDVFFNRHFKNYDRDRERTDYYYMVQEIIETSIQGNMTYVKSPEFHQAIQAIQDIIALADSEGIELYSDIHEDNIMWRMTSFGPQLVITDPVWIPN